MPDIPINNSLKKLGYITLVGYSRAVHGNYHFKQYHKSHLLGGFTVSMPALPGCITYGEDVDEAITMAKEAIELYIEKLQERGETIPDDKDTLEYSLNLETA